MATQPGDTRPSDENSVLADIVPLYTSGLPSNESPAVVGTSSQNDSPTKESIMYSVWPRSASVSRTPLRDHPSPARENMNKRIRGNTEEIFTMSPMTERSMFDMLHSPVQRDGTLPRRRKVSIPEIGVGMMTTVQEGCMDSPTIPGHPAVNGEPQSSPRGIRRKLVAGDTSRPLSVKAEIIEAETVEALSSTLPGLRQIRRPYEVPERRASMQLPRGLAPLVIPSNGNRVSRAQTVRQLRQKGTEEHPPQVPPKSPRYLNKVSPHSIRTSVSASGSLPMMHTANSSVTSLSTADSIISPKRMQTPKRGENILSSLRSGGVLADRQPPTPPSAKESRGGSPKYYRWGLSIDASNAFRLEQSSGSIPSHSQHERRGSETSVLNRGRPTKRGDMSLQRTISKSHNRGANSLGEIVLPEGFKTSDANMMFTDQEMCSLKKGAEEQVAEFEVLYHKDELTLLRELRLLDERCEYLRRTHTSLREGRRNLHGRMIDSLKSPHAATFSVANTIKQQEALMELDDSIDDWMAKLEVADDRRTKIQQKLLEHFAAALTLKPRGFSQTQSAAEEHTPPRSPEKHIPPRSSEKIDRSFSSERRDVESIHVYADSGVAALLAEIEREIDMMV